MIQGLDSCGRNAIVPAASAIAKKTPPPCRQESPDSEQYRKNAVTPLVRNRQLSNSNPQGDYEIVGYCSHRPVHETIVIQGKQYDGNNHWPVGHSFLCTSPGENESHNPQKQMTQQ
jgi:hypothetical protein